MTPIVLIKVGKQAYRRITVEGSRKDYCTGFGSGLKVSGRGA